MRKNSGIAAVMLCCALVSCSVKTIPPSDIYTIVADGGQSGNITLPASTNTVRDHVLQLAPMQAPRMFTSTDMVYTASRYQQSSYAYSQWSDAPVRVLPLLFQTALEASGRFGAVIGSPSAAQADFLLESTLLDFSHHVHADSPSEGVVHVRFYLIDTATRSVAATRAFSARFPSSAPAAGDGAVALNRASNRVAHDLAAWLQGMEL